MAITEAQATMDFIMEERGRELVGEQIRWVDLKRWGKLVERVKLHNPQAAANVKDIHNVRPIPQAQIDRSEGGKARVFRRIRVIDFWIKYKFVKLFNPLSIFCMSAVGNLPTFDISKY